MRKLLFFLAIETIVREWCGLFILFEGQLFDRLNYLKFVKKCGNYQCAMDDVLTLAANLLKELSPVVPFTQLKKIFLTISTDIAANISRECIESLKASIGTINA